MNFSELLVGRNRRKTWQRAKIKIKELIVRYLKKAARLPWIARISVGVLLCAGGVFGFLPILGFWMLPLGVLVFGLCIPITDRLIGNWVGRLEAEIRVDHNIRTPY